MLLFRRIVSVVLSIVPLLFIVGGVMLILRAVQARNPSIYSVQGEQYFTDALMFSCVGLFGLFGCRRLWDANAGWRWILLPMAALIFAVVFPNVEQGHHGSPVQRASSSTERQLKSLAHASIQLAKEHGQFTCETSAKLFSSSLFVREGQALPYVIQCVPDATGPALSTPPERPGTLLFAVSSDRKQAWFTATVLAQNPQAHAIWLTRQGQPVVIVGQK
jgi:hypothetical protein